MVNLWLDDIRPAPEGWVHVKTVNEAIELMKTRTVDYASLDHDLGIFASEGGNGVKFTDWMAEFQCWPNEGVFVHSSNPVGVNTMLATVDRYSPYPVEAGYSSGRGYSSPEGGWPGGDHYIRRDY